MNAENEMFKLWKTIEPDEVMNEEIKVNKEGVRNSNKLYRWQGGSSINLEDKCIILKTGIIAVNIADKYKEEFLAEFGEEAALHVYISDHFNDNKHRLFSVFEKNEVIASLEIQTYLLESGLTKPGVGFAYYKWNKPTPEEKRMNDTILKYIERRLKENPEVLG